MELTVLLGKSGLSAEGHLENFRCVVNGRPNVRASFINSLLSQYIDYCEITKMQNFYIIYAYLKNLSVPI